MKKVLLILWVAVAFLACQRQAKLPQNVAEVLDKAGSNKQELLKVIHHYSEPEDSLKLKAAYFLIGNMGDKSFVHFSVVDSTGTDVHFNVLDYPNYTAMVAAWDSIEAIRGPIHNQRDSVAYDAQVMTAKYLINNIDLAFRAWREFPWAHHINFAQFCEYILPYRGSNEPLEAWRPYFYKKYHWVADSVKDKSDPVEAADLINNDIKSWFKFDPRFYRQSTDQGLSDMLANKKGRCEDMTNLAMYAMRAMAIPVMSDFTPYWAKTGNNHAWNALIDKNGKVVIFMGAGANPGEYHLNQAKAKVYRKTFAKQPNSLAAIKPKWEAAPPYINRSNIVDVTRDYGPVADVNLTLAVPKPDSTHFAYICVFNSGEWRAIHWSRIAPGNKVRFTDMGLDIAYLPAYYVHKKIVPAGEPFILSKTGKVQPLVADTTNRQTVRLISTTRKITRNATDSIEKAYFTPGKKYELFYWKNGKWNSLGKQTAGRGALVFRNVPRNALYWLVAEKSNREERIFTIDSNGRQVWW